MEQQSVLDDTVVAELRDIMGTEYPTLVEAWLRDAAQRLEELRQSHAQGNRKALREAAHTLKGSSSNLGAYAVSAHCAVLEQKADAWSPDVIAKQLVEISAAVEQASQALRTTLSEQQPAGMPGPGG